VSALFRPWANTVARVSLAGLATTVVGGFGFLMLYVRSPLWTGQNDPVQQPVQFDHRHHVGDVGLDCRYCHQTVDRSPSAGIPATSLCLNCHAQVWNKSSLLDPVRQSFFNDKPIRWERVHKLPDFVYFNHSIHLAKGVACESCHGRVDRMAAIAKVSPLTMGWCLDCHRDPAPNLRPREAVTAMGWTPEGNPAEVGRELAKRYDIHARTSCTTCHR
jgi:Cytochrome c7 and related cytochrome c/Class III cytochrome C family